MPDLTANPETGARRWLPLALRAVLSLITIYSVWVVYQVFRSTVMLESEVPVQVQERSAAAFGPAQDHASNLPRLPWPKYPGASRVSANAMEWNDVPVLNEELVVRGSNTEIFSFYRRAMLARGWRDNTEQQFRMPAATYARATGSRMMQNEAFLRQYDEMRSNYLSLRRGDASILIQIQAASRPWKRRVTLKYMETGSVNDFAYALERAMRQRGRPGQPMLTTSEQIGPDRHSTRFYISRQSATFFFEAMLARLESEGWAQNETLRRSKQLGSARGGRQAYLFRENDFAILMVQPSEDRSGSQAVVTQIETVR